jgi:hypothetical protein
VARLRDQWRAGESALLRLARDLADFYHNDRRGPALEQLCAALEPHLRRDPAARLQRTEHYLAQIAARPLAALLADYLGEPEGTLFHERVEQMLAERSLDTTLDRPPGWPAALLARPSGALLAWAAHQRARLAGPPPGCLAQRPALRAEQARLFVRAWRLWPDNPALADPELLAALAGWLAADCWPQWELVPLLAERAPDLAAGCAQGWLGAPAEQAALPAVSALLDDPRSRATGETLLRRLLIGAGGQPALLRPLAELAFRRGCYQEVLGAVSLLAPQDGRAPDREALAWQIAALAATGQRERAARAYAEDWLKQPGAPPFPFPRLLLPALPPETKGRLLQTADLERLEPRAQLEARMARGEAEATLPGWAALIRQALAPEQNSERWPALIAASPAALELLVWLTEACLQVPPDELHHHMAQQLWHGLLQHAGAGPGPLRLQAGAALVLLAHTDQQALRLYEQHLQQAPLAQLWVQRAARRYLTALARLQLWEQAAQFVGRPDFTRMRDLLGPAELRYWQLLRGIEQALDARQPGLECAGMWVQALCLPLPDQQVQLLVAHFAQRCQHDAALGSPALRELAPHMLRRGRALGERLLTGLASAEERQQAQKQLAEASLDDLDRLLSVLGGDFGGGADYRKAALSLQRVS